MTKKEQALKIYQTLPVKVLEIARIIFGIGFDNIIENSEDEERLSVVIEAMKTAIKINEKNERYNSN